MLELDGDFFGRKRKCVCRDKWRGATMGPRGRGHGQGGGRALDPRGQVLAPPAVFLVPDILKYSKKNHIKLAWHLEDFYFRGIFILHG